MIHPRDLYSTLESIWISNKSYLAKRLPLEQAMTDISSEELDVMTRYLDAEIKKRWRELGNMRRVNTIAKEVLSDI